MKTKIEELKDWLERQIENFGSSEDAFTMGNKWGHECVLNKVIRLIHNDRSPDEPNKELSIYEFTLTNVNGTVTKHTIPCEYMSAHRIARDILVKSSSVLNVDFERLEKEEHEN